jgi:hypothetical protein
MFSYRLKTYVNLWGYAAFFCNQLAFAEHGRTVIISLLNILRSLLICFITVVSCASARSAGVTLMTHGFNGNITDWVIPMLQRVPDYPGFPGTNFSCYSITISESGGTIVASRTLLSGSSPLAMDSGEILIKLDWSSLAGLFGASSTEVAGGAVNALLSTSLFPELGGRALAELPLHLAGHSRGSSVISEMARLLGAQGVWVDHVTLIDPHPVFELGDAAVRVWQNVLFAESFWQMNSDFTCPNGESAVGAYNRFLSNLSGGYSCAHSDVHLWYHGTIDLATPTGDSDATITSAERQTWWTAAEAAGAQAGFRYSRIGGGDRLSTAEPAGQGTGRIRDGVNQRWDFGAGTSANRVALPANNGLWPNVIVVNLTGTNTIAPGASTTAGFSYQSGASTNQFVTAQLFLDRDANPLNSSSVEVVNTSLSNSGTNDVYSANLMVTAPTNIPPGDYALYAQLSSGGKTRYLYAPQTITVLTSGEPPRFAGVHHKSDATQLTIDAHIGQRVVVQASSNLSAWVSIQTNVVTSSPLVVIDRATAPAQRFYRAVVVP